MSQTSLESFFTKELSEKGQRVPLRLPNGEETEHWFHVVGTDSDRFRNGAAEINQRFLKEAGKTLTPEESAKQREEKNLLFLALTITDWSFPAPCDEANKVRLLRNAPALAEMVDRFSINRRNFFTPPAKAS
jgi:hypothetical protein